MTALYEENFDVHDHVEVHWSSSTILAIFFAASLVSAVFFGLGYSFGGAGTGKHSFASNALPSSNSAAASTDLPAQPTPSPSSNKPSPFAKSADTVKPLPLQNAPSTPPAALRTIAAAPVPHTAAHVAEKKSVPVSAAPIQSPTAAQTNSTHIMVQIGAIGNRKDAERLVAELRKKGFHAGIYQDKHDKFLHVQIGPFKDVAQAQSKRHQIMASGFHAILKSTS
jgi:cell division septation protein DedD